jgi:major membrane immunogen (membrane-anchored lipoprotein)
MTFRCITGILISAVLATACAGNDGSNGSCEEGGQTYEDGEQWDCSDGCNYCGCNDGMVQSTLMACE